MNAGLRFRYSGFESWREHKSNQHHAAESPRRPRVLNGVKFALVPTFLFLLFLTPIPTRAACSWSTQQQALTAAVLVVQAVDWAQTRSALAERHTHEQNAVLGSRPSPAAINQYFAMIGAATVAMGCWAPDPWRDRGLSFALGLSGHTVWVNYTRGFSP